MKKHLLHDRIFFIFPMLVAFCVALYLVFGLQFIFPDALSRTFHAYTVFFGNEPKFANIGFVWPPAPTLATLPFVLIKPFNVFGFAGNMISVIFLAVTSLYLNKIFKFFHMSLKKRFIFMLLFLLNPMILLYGANGMSEMMAVGFMVAAIYYLLSYLKKDNLLFLIGTSATTGLAIMTRYEMLALVPAIILLLIFTRTKNLQIINRETIKTLEGNLLLFSMPILFLVGIWVFANWAIMHNPLYFANGGYSNTAQANQLMNESAYFRSLSHNFVGTITYVLQKVFVLYPAFLFLILLLLVQRFQRQNWNYALVVIFLPLSIIFFHTFLLYQGQSFGWLRFFIYIIPATFILSALLLEWCKHKIYYKVFFSLMLAVHIISSLWTFHAMSDPQYGKEEHVLIKAITTQDTSQLNDYSYAKNLVIATYLKNNVTDGRILIDDFTGFPIIYLSGNTNLFIQTIDKEFAPTLQYLKFDTNAKYILVRKKDGLGNLDAINQKYPTMFEDGAGIGVLIKDFGEWRLYKKI